MRSPSYLLKQFHISNKEIFSLLLCKYFLVKIAVSVFMREWKWRGNEGSRFCNHNQIHSPHTSTEKVGLEKKPFKRLTPLFFLLFIGIVVFTYYTFTIKLHSYTDWTNYLDSLYKKLMCYKKPLMPSFPSIQYTINTINNQCASILQSHSSYKNLGSLSSKFWAMLLHPLALTLYKYN